MKELFRERDFTVVGYFQTVLEGEGITTFIRNQDLTNIMTDIPIPEFFPALCVVNDEDYDRGMEILKGHVQAAAQPAGADWKCAACGEENPGSFEVCWSCGKASGGAE